MKNIEGFPRPDILPDGSWGPDTFPKPDTKVEVPKEATVEVPKEATVEIPTEFNVKKAIETKTETPKM